MIHFCQIILRMFMRVSSYSLFIEFLPYLRFCLTFHLTILSTYKMSVFPTFKQQMEILYGLIHLSLDQAQFYKSIVIEELFKSCFFLEICLYKFSSHSLTYKSGFIIRIGFISRITHIHVSVFQYIFMKLRKIVYWDIQLPNIHYRNICLNIHILIIYLYLFLLVN